MTINDIANLMDDGIKCPEGSMSEGCGGDGTHCQGCSDCLHKPIGQDIIENAIDSFKSFADYNKYKISDERLRGYYKCNLSRNGKEVAVLIASDIADRAKYKITIMPPDFDFFKNLSIWAKDFKNDLCSPYKWEHTERSGRSMREFFIVLNHAFDNALTINSIAKLYEA